MPLVIASQMRGKAWTAEESRYAELQAATFCWLIT